jgi:hypothetical protein
MKLSSIIFKNFLDLNVIFFLDFTFGLLKFIFDFLFTILDFFMFFTHFIIHPIIITTDLIPLIINRLRPDFNKDFILICIHLSSISIEFENL